MLAVSRVLNYVIAALVAVQAASHAWMSAGIGQFVMNGGVIDKSMMEQQSGPPPFPEVLGAMIHGMNGTMVIPIVALAGLIVAIVSKQGKVVRLAVVVIVLVALQVLLGILAFSASAFALLHGLNAMLLFAAALLGAHAAKRGAVDQGGVGDRVTVHAS